MSFLFIFSYDWMKNPEELKTDLLGLEGWTLQSSIAVCSLFPVPVGTISILLSCCALCPPSPPDSLLVALLFLCSCNCYLPILCKIHHVNVSHCGKLSLFSLSKFDQTLVDYKITWKPIFGSYKRLELSPLVIKPGIKKLITMWTGHTEYRPDTTVHHI